MTRIPGKQFIGDFLDFVSGSFRSRIQAGTLTADRTLTAPDKTGTIAVDTARSTSIQNLTAAGLVQLAAGADSVASISTPAEIRSAAGLSRLVGNNGGIIKTGAGAPYASPYTLSVQSDGVTWLEILGENGAGSGAFFGVNGTAFEQYAWDGGPIRFFTGPTRGSSVNRWVFGNDGHTALPGTISPRWYTVATLPAATLFYGAICIVYTAGGATIPVYSDQVNWRRFSDDTIL
jgi:hypothetical protein